MPYKNLISNVLAAHADQILQDQNYGENYTRLFPENTNLPPLLNLAEQVKETLQPVAPPNAFKEQLQRDLMAAARLKQVRAEQQNETSLFVPLLISAAIALMGLTFLRLRMRQQSAA